MAPPSEATVAWTNLQPLAVTCHSDTDEGIPPNGWDVTCRVADKQRQWYKSLEANPELRRILDALRRHARREGLRRPLAPEDYSENYGAALVALAVGHKADGTLLKTVAFQKTVKGLHERGGHYGTSTELRIGVKGTLGAPRMTIYPLYLVEGKGSGLLDGPVYSRLFVELGERAEALIGQLPPPGCRLFWTKESRRFVEQRPQHPLFEYVDAPDGFQLPIAANVPSRERSDATKAGIQKWKDETGKKWGQKSGAKRKKQLERGPKTTEMDVATLYFRYGRWFFDLIVEARACVQTPRPPAAWAAAKLTPSVLDQSCLWGLEDDYFLLKLPESNARERFDMLEFVEKDHRLTSQHVTDWTIRTQRGKFDTHTVAVALRLVKETEVPPEPPRRDHRPRKTSRRKGPTKLD